MFLDFSTSIPKSSPFFIDVRDFLCCLDFLRFTAGAECTNSAISKMEKITANISFNDAILYSKIFSIACLLLAFCTLLNFTFECLMKFHISYIIWQLFFEMTLNLKCINFGHNSNCKPGFLWYWLIIDLELCQYAVYSCRKSNKSCRKNIMKLCLYYNYNLHEN